MKPTDKLRVDAFSMTVGDIKNVALDPLHGLSMSVGWPHRAEDWELLRHVGSGIVALDEIGRVLGSAMWCRYNGDLCTIGMVITSPRLQALGTGQWLMERIFNEAGASNYRLNATRAARRLYLSLGFKPERTVQQCQGIAHTNSNQPDLPAKTELRPLGETDLNAMIKLDGIAFGVERPAVITELLQQSKGYGLFRENTLAAFSLSRPFGRGHVVGPVIATNDAEAIAVVQPHVDEHEGQFLRLDTHMETGPFADFLSQCGMPVFDTVLTMSLGKSMAEFTQNEEEKNRTYALASQALG